MLSNHAVKWLRSTFRIWPLGVAAIIMACVPLARTSATGSDFNIQVAPSPLVVHLTPGQTQTANVTIRNFSNHSETLQPGLKGIQVSADSSKVSLSDALPADMSSWTHFSPSLITVAPGATVQLTLSFATPYNVGFSYSVAISLTSTRTTGHTGTGTGIKPQVVVFCLININRDDARSELSVAGFSSDHAHYSFLPANFSVTVKNSGNIISQPTGNIFIQRSFNDSKPIATLPLNAGGGYVLPETTRAFNLQWSGGFPYYATDKDGRRHLRWDWKHLSDFRFGRYVAKTVIMYDNGRQDIPVIASLSFWVIPWWLLVLLTLTLIVLIMGVIGWGWLIFKGTRKVKGYAARHKK